MAILFPGNLGAQTYGFEVSIDRVGPIGRVDPDIPSGLRGEQNIFKHLPVTDRPIRDRILPNELVPSIHILMVLVAIVVFARLPRPTSLRVFLSSFPRLTVPLRRTLFSFLVVASSSREFHCVGMGISEASISWPSRGCQPCVAREAIIGETILFIVSHST